MEFGIVGLERAGKSTLFSLLTSAPAPTSRGYREARVGLAQVPDARLAALAALFQPRKVTPATVRFVDVPSLSKGGSDSLNLPELRLVDALAVVIRGFTNEAVPHPEGSVNPARDLELIETELLLADLQVAEARLARLARDLARRKSLQLEQERQLLERCTTALAAGHPLRELELTAEEEKLIKGFTFLSRKPMLVILNADEAATRDLEGALRHAGLEPLRGRPRLATSVVCAPLEEEIARLSSDEQAEFLAELGLPDRALDRLLSAAFRLLGLICFYTAGEDECRAWPIREGTRAAQAAGTVHSDFERGFIRAEVVDWRELLAAGSFAACRSRGTLRLEGRDYLVREDDVIVFRFNV
jgi:GTP-binding protein YchF